MIRAFRDWFLDQLAMYAAYHTDRRNQFTHYVGVPLIIFSILIVLDQARLGESFSAAILVLGVLLSSYLVAVPVVGILSLIICVPLYLAAESVAVMAPMTRWLVTAACFVVGWAIQFIGHVYEGRRPAFTVNMLQIFMAPGFLVAEMMFSVGLQRSLAEALHLRAQKFARV
jgi:uncharacterized membrane protein YGL010W